MGVYRRAMAYFVPDWALIAVLIFLIGVSVGSACSKHGR